MAGFIEKPRMYTELNPKVWAAKAIEQHDVVGHAKRGDADAMYRHARPRGGGGYSLTRLSDDSSMRCVRHA